MNSLVGEGKEAMSLNEMMKINGPRIDMMTDSSDHMCLAHVLGIGGCLVVRLCQRVPRAVHDGDEVLQSCTCCTNHTCCGMAVLLVICEQIIEYNS